MNGAMNQMERPCLLLRRRLTLTASQEAAAAAPSHFLVQRFDNVGAVVELLPIRRVGFHLLNRLFGSFIHLSGVSERVSE